MHVQIWHTNRSIGTVNHAMEVTVRRIGGGPKKSVVVAPRAYARCIVVFRVAFPRANS
jgi:hypothetical protein